MTRYKPVFCYYSKTKKIAHDDLLQICNSIGCYCQKYYYCMSFLFVYKMWYICLSNFFQTPKRIYSANPLISSCMPRGVPPQWASLCNKRIRDDDNDSANGVYASSRFLCAIVFARARAQALGGCPRVRCCSLSLSLLLALACSPLACKILNFCLGVFLQNAAAATHLPFPSGH